jgi:hypothetical protein
MIPSQRSTRPDRRRQLPLARRKGLFEAYNMAFELGSRRPSFSINDVFSVRGQCLAALTEKTDYGNDMHSEFFLIIQIDPSLERHRRSLVFDPDDHDAATAELDRLHAEIEQTRREVSPPGM